MNNTEFLELLTKSIINVTTNDGDILNNNFELKNYIDKYSSIKISSVRLFSNGELVKTKNAKITYSCLTCNSKHTILLKKFLLKNTLLCSSCRETTEKRNNQSKYLKKSLNEFGIIKSFKEIAENKILNIKEKISLSIKEFDSESNFFKNDYFDNHLNNNEFEKIKDKIFKVNGVIMDKNFQYIEILKINNQMKYSSFLYDEKNDKLINFNNINYICDSCSNIFSSTRKPKEKYKKNKKFICKQCYLSNRIFKVKSIKNINNNIRYQSSPELFLINFCNENNILIENGPKVKFIFNGKERIYNVDYYIPKYNLIIEIKDNHIWHKNQVESGKWFLKEKSAMQYANDNDLSYKLVFSQYLNEFINSTFKI